MSSFSISSPSCVDILLPQCYSSSKWRSHEHQRISNISFHTYRSSTRCSLLVSAKTSSNNSPITSPKSGPKTIQQELSISTFLNEVSVLVKMVDVRGIVDLQVKQFGCEVTIRKQEALQPKASNVIAMPPHYVFQSQTPPSQFSAPTVASSSLTPAPTPVAALPAPAKSSDSSHPPLHCPMAGTFYRSPAPGEPPFVKVGDKVQKGQVICIIEAMKLMNEIEADHSGTIAEILVEDGKAVSVDLPLFVILP